MSRLAVCTGNGGPVGTGAGAGGMGAGAGGTGGGGGTGAFVFPQGGGSGGLPKFPLFPDSCAVAGMRNLLLPRFNAPTASTGFCVSVGPGELATDAHRATIKPAHAEFGPASASIAAMLGQVDVAALPSLI